MTGRSGLGGRNAPAGAEASRSGKAFHSAAGRTPGNRPAGDVELSARPAGAAIAIDATASETAQVNLGRHGPPRAPIPFMRCLAAAVRISKNVYTRTACCQTCVNGVVDTSRARADLSFYRFETFPAALTAAYERARLHWPER